MPDESNARYHRQMLLPEIGPDGQRRLASSHALVVGCGALGNGICQSLVRAGVGTLTIVDRDVVEITNLQRQSLFDEEDARDGLPKAEAARRRLARINSSVTINAAVDDFNHSNALEFARHADVIVDGVDNFETRFLLNDLSVALGLPYVYGGAVATHGMTATFLPHRPPLDSADLKLLGLGASAGAPRRRYDDSFATPCFRCVFGHAPPPGDSPTCDTVGVLGPVTSAIADFQAAAAIKVLVGRFADLDGCLITLDLWHNEFRRLNLASARDPASTCPCCGRGVLDDLVGRNAGAATSMCGRDSVQIVPPRQTTLDLAALARQLRPHGNVRHNPFMLRAQVAEGPARYELTVFPNGRAIIQGTTKPEIARSIYARYIGL